MAINKSCFDCKYGDKLLEKIKNNSSLKTVYCSKIGKSISADRIVFFTKTRECHKSRTDDENK